LQLLEQREVTGADGTKRLLKTLLQAASMTIAATNGEANINAAKLTSGAAAVTTKGGSSLSQKVQKP
jgi:hypothetical protein